MNICWWVFANFVFFAFLCVGVRSYLLKKSTGVEGIVKPAKDDPGRFVHNLLKIIAPVTGVVVFLYAALPVYMTAFSPLVFSLGNWHFLGVAILLLSTFFTFYAQHAMGNSWRVGFDTKNKTRLVTGGIYRFSRNPIYLGVFGAYLGLLIAIPSWLILLLIVLGSSLLQVQVRFEEKFLKRTQGASFAEYCKTTPRWF